MHVYTYNYYLYLYKSPRFYVFFLSILGEFGCLEWSPCETKLLYIAEKKTPKSEPFLGPGSKKSSEATIVSFPKFNL